MSDLDTVLEVLRTRLYPVGNSDPALLGKLLETVDAVEALAQRKQAKTALDYAPLVGRVVQMERPATRDELDDFYPDTVGMECLVAEISDGDSGVLVCGDEGLAMLIRPTDQDAWRFTVWPDAATRGQFTAFRPKP